MDLLSNLWATPFPPPMNVVIGNSPVAFGPNSPVSLLRTKQELYAASNGAAMRLDIMAGAQLALNTQSGKYLGPTSIAMSNDGGTLLMGVAGNAVGLDPTTLETRWTTALPNADTFGVFVISSGAGGVFASGGRVYLINPSSGDIRAENDLPGDGNGFTRAALTSGGANIVVAMSGHVLLLDAVTLTKMWRADLPDGGNSAVDIAIGRKGIFAGCRGRVHLLDYSGHLLQTNTLPGLGNEDARLSLSPDENYLAVGTNGYGVALSTADLTTLWKQSLPNAEKNVTPLAVDNAVYFAANGWIHARNARDGGDATEREMCGPGSDVPSNLTLDLDESLLWVAKGGSVQCFTLDNYLSGTDPWMWRLQPLIGGKRLTDIAIPGTHDSGTYSITSGSASGLDAETWTVALRNMSILGGLPLCFAVNRVIANWAKAQTKTFLEQLSDGIRYFDLRLQYDKGEYSFTHSLVGASLNDLISDVNTFYATPGYDREILILDFQHVFNIDDLATTNDVLSTLITGLNVEIITGVAAANNPTLNDIWKSNGRIVLLFNNKWAVNNNQYVCGYDFITSNWGDKQDSSALKSFLDTQFQSRGSGLFVLQGQLTPDITMISRNLTSDLTDMAGRLNPQLCVWISRDWANTKINIVICDDYADANFVDTVIRRNRV